MKDRLDPEFIGGVPWQGPGLAKEEVELRKNACTAHHLSRLTASPEFAQWVADKRRWNPKDIVKAALLLSTLIGAAAVGSQLWPAGSTPVGPQLDAAAPGHSAGASAYGEASAVDSTFRVRQSAEGDDEKGVNQTAGVSSADHIREPKHSLEDQLRSGQQYIKDKIFHGGAQARVADLERAIRDLEGNAWYDSVRMAELQSQHEKLEAESAVYTTLLTGLSLVLGTLWMNTRRRMHQQEEAHKLAREKANEAEQKLEKESWDHTLLQDLHAVQTREKAALEQALADLKQAHSQLLQSQSRVVAPPPGLHASPFGDQLAQAEAQAEAQAKANLNGHSTDEDEGTARKDVVVELFPDKAAGRKNTSSTGGYWPAGPWGISTRVPALTIEDKGKVAGGASETSGTPRILTETDGGEENRSDLDNITLSAREWRKHQRSMGEKDKHVQYSNSQIKSLEAQLEQVTASLAHIMEEKSDTRQRMHSESQDMDEMSILLARKMDDVEFMDAENLALQQVARQALQWLDTRQEPPPEVLRAMQDKLSQCSQHFEDKVSSEV